jgi:hypothetical protein
MVYGQLVSDFFRTDKLIVPQEGILNQSDIPTGEKQFPKKNP